MPKPNMRRWQKAVAVVQQGVEAHVALRQAEVNRETEFLSFLQAMQPPAATPLIPMTRVKAKGRPAPGSIPDRVLQIIGEFDGPVTMDQVLGEKHGATKHLVVHAVRGLVNTGHTWWAPADQGTAPTNYPTSKKRGPHEHGGHDDGTGQALRDRAATVRQLRSRE